LVWSPPHGTGIGVAVCHVRESMSIRSISPYNLSIYPGSFDIPIPSSSRRSAPTSSRARAAGSDATIDRITVKPWSFRSLARSLPFRLRGSPASAGAKG